MTRSLIVFICLLPVVFLPASSLVQQPTKIPRIGYLSGASSSTNIPRREVFRQGLRELGYVEGKSIFIEYRYAEGKLDLLRSLAADLVHRKVDIILTAGPGPTRVAKATTSAIPIVMAQDTDPVGSGFIASLARPGGNITGLATNEANRYKNYLAWHQSVMAELADD